LPRARLRCRHAIEAKRALKEIRMAHMAATRTPEVFACIADLFGISNLMTFMATIPP
jgi:hypothetical protein